MITPQKLAYPLLYHILMTATFLFRLHRVIEKLDHTTGADAEALNALKALAWQADFNLSDWLDTYYVFMEANTAQATGVWNELKTVLDDICHAKMVFEVDQPIEYWAKAS